MAKDPVFMTALSPAAMATMNASRIDAVKVSPATTPPPPIVMSVAMVPPAGDAKVARISSDVAETKAFRNMQPVQLNNPALFASMARIQPRAVDPTAAEGTARSQVRVPICPVAEPSDVVLYDDSADAAKKYYLPRYRLRENGGQYEIAAQSVPEGGWRLVAGLEPYPAPELGAIGGAHALTHDIAVFFLYRGGAAFTIEVRLDFTERADDAKGITVAAHLTNEQLNNLLFALKNPAAAPKFVVRRAITVATAIKAPAPAPPNAAPVLMRKATLPPQASAQRMAVVQPQMMMMKDLGPATPVRPLPPPPPPQTPQPAERYQTVRRALDDVADPELFILDPQLHAYFYAGLSQATAGPVEFRRHQKEHPKGSFNARFHTYLQSKAEPWAFYYLADSFKLSRHDAAPFLPRMVVHFAAPDGVVDNVVVTVDYVVEPYVDAVRLKGVIPELAAEIPATSPRREPELRPLQTSSATLKLWQPSAAGAAAVERKGMPIDLANGFLDSITLPLDGFRQMYAAACSSADTSLFTGVVLVDTGTPPQETIPFSVRFADTHGELLSFTEQPSDAVAVQMENSTESPLRIPSLPVTIRRGGAEVPAIVEGLALPLDNVAPGTRIPFTVRPQQPLPGSGPLDAVFDTSAVQVLPDAQQILPLISDTSVPAQYERQIEVDTLPDLLGDPASDTAIIAVAVEFRNSGVLRLQRDHLSGIATVRLSLMDLLLGRDVQGKYSFRQHIVRKNGTQTNDEAWRESDQGILFVPIT